MIYSLLTTSLTVLCAATLLQPQAQAHSGAAHPVTTEIVKIVDTLSTTTTRKAPVGQVVGRLLGTGTVILYNYKPAVMTSSHVLQGQTSALVTLYPNPAIKMPVIFDSPLDDIAILDADAVVSPAEKTRLLAIAANGFCNQTNKDQKAQCLHETNHVDYNAISDFSKDARLIVSENGKIRIIESLSPESVTKRDDIYIRDEPM